MLPRAEVDKLVDARTRYGIKTRPGAERGCPVSAEEATEVSERFDVTREELISLVDEALRARGLG